MSPPSALKENKLLLGLSKARGGKMLKKNIDRREFMTHVMKAMAMATGFSVNEVSRLLAAENKEIASNLEPAMQARYNIYQRSTDEEIKALKVLIEDNQRVFESQYGRITPIVLKEDPLKPGEFLRFCRVEFGRAGGNVDTCDTFYGKGASCPSYTGCVRNGCNSQNCPRFAGCNENRCPGQVCPIFSDCVKINVMVLDRSFFDRYRSDPYVEHLFERFEVNTADELAIRVNNLLNEIR